MPLKLYLFYAISFLVFSLSYGQSLDSVSVLRLIENQDSLPQDQHLKALKSAAYLLLDKEDFDSYLKVKYEVFTILEKEGVIDIAYAYAGFDDVTFQRIQKIWPIGLSVYYMKLLRFSIRNRHFLRMKQLVKYSLNEIDVSTRADSIYLSSNLSQLGLVYRYMGEYDSSFEYLQNSLDIGITLYGASDMKVTQIYYNIGANYAIIGSFEKAKDYLLKSLDIKLLHYSEDDYQLNHEYNALGMVYEGLGEYDLALSYHEKTIEIKKSVSEEFNSNLGRSYLNLGSLLLSMGQPQLAYQKSKVALNGIEGLDGEYTEMSIWLYNNMGKSLIAMDRPEEAKKYLEIALKRNTNKFDLSIDGSLEENLGVVMMKMKEYDEALKYLESAQEKFYRDSPTHQRLASLDIAISQCYYFKKQYATAEDFAFRSLDRLQMKLTKKHPLLFQSYYQLAQIFQAKGLAEKSIFYIIEIDSLSNVSSLNLLKKVNLKLEILEPINIAGFEIEKAKGDQLISKTLKRYVPVEERYLLSKEIKNFYTHCLTEWNTTIGLEDSQDILQIFNSSKNSMLKATVLSSQVSEYTNIPQEITKREFRLAKKIRNLEKHFVYTYDTLDYSTTQLNLENIDKLQDQYKLLLDSIERYYPKYFDLKFAGQQSDLNNLVRSLDKGVAVLDYFIGDEFVWVLSIYNGKVNLLKKPFNDEWQETFLMYRNALLDFDKVIDESDFENTYNQFLNLSSKIYNYLLVESIDEMPKNINSLIIIPDEILNFIPFETLVQSRENSNEQDYRKLDYLLRDYNISYAYALSLVGDLSNNEAKSKNNYVGFAPTYTSDSDVIDNDFAPLLDMPAARRSVSESAALFHGKAFLGDKASDVSFLDHAHESSILQLAMHCIIDNDSPMDTKLMFGSDASDESNYLKASDLYNMQIDNHLSVLTACNTGVGKIREGEGVISLSRAFTYAGSESLMMSLWSVPDAQTSNIMKSFFYNLKSGNRKDESLRIAKINYLAEAPKSASHPMFWAGFIITGNTAPVLLSADSNPLYYVIPLVGFLMFLLYKSRAR